MNLRFHRGLLFTTTHYVFKPVPLEDGVSIYCTRVRFQLSVSNQNIQFYSKTVQNKTLACLPLRIAFKIHTKKVRPRQDGANIFEKEISAVMCNFKATC